MYPNKENEKFFMRLVRTGHLEVNIDGKVLNRKTKNYIGYKNRTGYIALGMKDQDGEVRHILVHRLVALSHLGLPVGSISLQVNHKDGIKTNNKASNLEMVSAGENVSHAYRTGLINTKARAKAMETTFAGELHPMSKLRRKDVKRMRLIRRLTGYPYAYIGKMFGVSKTAALRAIKKESHRKY